MKKTCESCTYSYCFPWWYPCRCCKYNQHDKHRGQFDKFEATKFETTKKSEDEDCRTCVFQDKGISDYPCNSCSYLGDYVWSNYVKKED